MQSDRREDLKHFLQEMFERGLDRSILELRHNKTLREPSWKSLHPASA
jgi:hypothetical protein